MKAYIPRVADGVTILCGIALLVVLLSRSGGPAPPSFSLSQLETESVGLKLEAASVGVDFRAVSPTLVMALQSDCGFCRESLPFYRRLLERDTPDVRIVVAAPLHDTGIGDYLASEGVNPDAVVFVEPGVLPVRGTPTLLVVDGKGLITHAWIGLLSADREAEVLDAVFS